ncbi:MAG: protein CpxP [Roseivirga sp.]|jgi:protein CpxP
MKKLAFVLIALIAFNTQAQERPTREKRDLSPEQVAVLKTKKMTLHLDLNKSQQKEIEALNLDIAKEHKEMKVNREKRKELMQDERFAMKNKILDKQIALKSKMKKILNEDQFAKWEKSKMHMAKGKRKHREGKERSPERRLEKRD